MRRRRLAAAAIALLLLFACSPGADSSGSVEPSTDRHTTPVSDPVSPPDEAGTPAPRSGEVTGSCDPSYPGICIPPPPPDLDCDDIEYRNFPVVRGDPHVFDDDGDGRGC